jgi:CHAT domain-containing protein
LGLGVSKAKPGFQALPSVPQELHDIVREGNNSNSGLLPGHILLDEAFTEDRLKDLLRVKYPVVHIASHFDLEADDESSFLLLGDGTHLTLAQLLLIPNLFAGIDLLTLSACQTGLGVIGAAGKGIDSFGALAQRKGAKAIIATLWPVADESTRLLTQRFYDFHQSGKLSKAEALQQAQLALLGKTPIDGRRSSIYAHPHFWAPFILIGNWQ